jgi:hypothetical protein
MHVDPEQISPGAQGLSQAPQCAGELVTSVQPEEQQLSGGVHVVAMLQAQVPTMQLSP